MQCKNDFLAVSPSLLTQVHAKSARLVCVYSLMPSRCQAGCVKWKLLGSSCLNTEGWPCRESLLTSCCSGSCGPLPREADSFLQQQFRVDHSSFISMFTRLIMNLSLTPQMPFLHCVVSEL